MFLYLSNLSVYHLFIYCPRVFRRQKYTLSSLSNISYDLFKYMKKILVLSIQFFVCKLWIFLCPIICYGLTFEWQLAACIYNCILYHLLFLSGFFCFLIFLNFAVICLMCTTFLIPVWCPESLGLRSLKFL